MELAIYIIVLVLYLAGLAWIGIATGRRTRDTADYAIGGRTIGPWVTALSFVAAYFSSVLIIGGGGFGYKFGMATIWIGAVNVLVGCFICWVVLGKRVRLVSERLGVMTISGLFQERYGSPDSRIFSAAIIFLFLIIYNVSVLKGMANAIEVLMNVPYWGGVLLSGFVIIFYVAVGGYLAVVWTSFLQAWVMIAGLILLTLFSLNAVGGVSNLHQRLAEIDPGLLSTPGLWGWAGLVSFCLVVSLGTWGMPQLVIRFYSIKDTRVLRLGTVVVTLGACVALLPYFNGAIARVLYPSLPSPDLAIPTLTRDILPPLWGAVFLAGVIAAGMSTFAGVLIIISSSLIKDIAEKGLSIHLEPARELRLTRLTSAGVGLISLAVALRPPALILVLTAFAWAVIASTNLWPLLFGIYWRRTNRAGAFASMVLGSATALIWTAFRNPYGIHGFIAGTAVGLVAIVVVSLMTKRPLPADTDRARGHSV